MRVCVCAWVGAWLSRSSSFFGRKATSRTTPPRGKGAKGQRGCQQCGLTCVDVRTTGLLVNYCSFLVVQTTSSITLKILNTLRNVGFVMFQVWHTRPSPPLHTHTTHTPFPFVVLHRDIILGHRINILTILRTLFPRRITIPRVLRSK